jgi:PAS domain S-box-containing protein
MEEGPVGQDTKPKLLDSLLDGAPLGIAVLDRDWRITHVNALAAGILGARPEALLGEDVWEGAPRLKGTAGEAPCRKALAEGTPASFAQTAGTATYEVRVTPTKDGLALWWLDVGERARTAERTLRLRALAHDLRTPLTVIGLNAELLSGLAARRGDAGERQKADAVGRAAQQLSDVAQQLSDTLREGTK